MAQTKKINAQGQNSIDTLAEVPFEEIRVGDRCRSLRGTLGTITLFDPTLDNGREKGFVEIHWDNGCCSRDCIFLSGVPWIGKVKYIGQPKEM